ncbi:MAG: hypothetical protein KJP07_16595 [Desulfatitalea sp.]|nr:hypothetical protein [Desulfatitalea sp.]
MKKKTFMLLCSVLIAGTANMAVALPLLNVLEIQSSSVAQVTATNLSTGVVQEWSDPSYLLVDVDGQGDLVDVHTGSFFDGMGFANVTNHFGSPPSIIGEDPQSISVEATSQLDLRFAVEGAGASIAALAVLYDTPGSVAFSIFDETAGAMLFSNSGWNFYTPDIHLTDGHIYNMHGLCHISSIGDGGSAEFIWGNSEFDVRMPMSKSLFEVRVPESKNLLIFVSGLLLLLPYGLKYTRR